MSVRCCLFRYQLSPETFGYTLVWLTDVAVPLKICIYNICVVNMSSYMKLAQEIESMWRLDWVIDETMVIQASRINSCALAHYGQ